VRGPGQVLGPWSGLRMVYGSRRGRTSTRGAKPLIGPGRREGDWHQALEDDGQERAGRGRARHFDGIGKVKIAEWSSRPNEVEREGG
jgi:hypothetical protein